MQVTGDVSWEDTIIEWEGSDSLETGPWRQARLVEIAIPGAIRLAGDFVMATSQKYDSRGRQSSCYCFDIFSPVRATIKMELCSTLRDCHPTHDWTMEELYAMVTKGLMLPQWMYITDLCMQNGRLPYGRGQKPEDVFVYANTGSDSGFSFSRASDTFADLAWVACDMNHKEHRFLGWMWVSMMLLAMPHPPAHWQSM